MTRGTYDVAKEVALREKRKQNASSRNYSGKSDSRVKRRKSNRRRKTAVSKFWFKIFSEELDIPVQRSGRIASFLAQIPVKNRKQLKKWLEQHRIGGVLGIENVGPAMLKSLTEAAAATPRRAKEDQLDAIFGPLEKREIPVDEEVVEQVVTSDLPGKVRIKAGKFKGHDTVTLHRDGIPIISFGKKKALAILDVVDNPAALSVLVKFAGAVNAEEQTPQTRGEALAEWDGEASIVKPDQPQKTQKRADDILDVQSEVDLLEEIIAHTGVQTEMGREFILVALECIELFDRKQRDYGSANIAMSGVTGLAYRLLDKACRLQNLIQKRERDGLPPENESIEDSLLDSANLGMIGILVTRGFWK